MYKVKLRKTNRERRKAKIRGSIFGTAAKPRLTVFRSNKYMYAQLVDDAKGVTVASVAKEAGELHKGKNKVEAASEVGALLAKKALKSKIEEAVFDRNGYKFHGRVRSVCEGARKGGLKI
jgi:large subunit ribosomal protein L18